MYSKVGRNEKHSGKGICQAASDELSAPDKFKDKCLLLPYLSRTLVTCKTSVVIIARTQGT